MTLTDQEDAQEIKNSSIHRIKSRSRRRPFSSSRLDLLSKPKDTKATWFTAFGPRLVWGNQDTMWPLSPSALTHVPSLRTEMLAKPKNNFRDENMILQEFQYSCGRNSTLWLVPPSAKTVNCSARTKSLSQPKYSPDNYPEQLYQCTISCGRESPIWRPSRSAMSCKSRERTELLAKPKSTHIMYQPARQPQTIISEAAKTWIPNAEISSLAQPKIKLDGLYRDAEWPVTPGAKQAEATQRQTELARHRRLAEGHEHSRDVLWKVTKGAKHAVASSRLCELSKPIIRETMDHVQFNPDAFRVSEAAKKAKASNRIEELAQPLTRK